MVQSSTTASTESAERTAASIPMSEDFKSAIRKWADANGFAVMSKALQHIVAAKIGYDLSNEPEPKARSRYGKDESGLVDAEYARLRNSFKSSQKTQWLRGTQLARKNKDDSLLAKLDAALLAAESKDWEPQDIDGKPDVAKRIEIREKAIANLKESKDSSKRIPDDYTDDKLDDLKEVLELNSAE